MILPLFIVVFATVVGILYWLDDHHEERPPSNLCGVVTRNGHPCMSYKMKGYNRCFHHLQNKPLKEECCICLIDKYPGAFRTFHCGHTFCKTCARKLDKCALCRADV